MYNLESNPAILKDYIKIYKSTTASLIFLLFCITWAMNCCVTGIFLMTSDPNMDIKDS